MATKKIKAKKKAAPAEAPPKKKLKAKSAAEAPAKKKKVAAKEEKPAKKEKKAAKPKGVIAITRDDLTKDAQKLFDRAVEIEASFPALEKERNQVLKALSEEGRTFQLPKKGAMTIQSRGEGKSLKWFWRPKPMSGGGGE